MSNELTDERRRNRAWHRLFAMLLEDRLTGMPYDVESEIDVSKQQQLLDILVIQRLQSTSTNELPDGLRDLSTYNLITFKSFHEALDYWSIQELTSHYVGYRKWISKSTDDLLDEDKFQLIAICSREPVNLKKQCELDPISPGVYIIRNFNVRIIVVTELPKEPQNAPLFLFASQHHLIQYGRNETKLLSDNTSRLVDVLWGGSTGVIEMKIDTKQWIDEIEDEFIQRLTVEKRLKGLRPEEVLKNYRPEERLQGMRPEDRLHGLRPEDRLQGLRPEERLQGMRPEERLQGMRPEEIESLLKKYLPQSDTKKP
jgi:hypothetical protein